MDEKEHSIRFINSSYDTLFRIPDGGTVEVQFPDRKFSAKCEYIDDYHTLVGDSVCRVRRPACGCRQSGQEQR